MKILRLHPLMGFAIAAVAMGIHSARSFGQCSPGGLDDGPLEVTKGGLDIDVHWTDDTWIDCGNAGDYFPATKAQDAIDSLDTSYDLFQSFGFPEPHLNSLPEYNIFAYDSSDTGVSYSGCITIDAPIRRCSPEPRIRKTLHHEMFHSIQRQYKCSVADCDSGSIGGTFGKWVSEGTARCLDDRLYSDLDGMTYSSTFWSEVSNYMDQTDTTLTGLSYRACLFWSYCCEQFGNTSTEPQRGIDFIRHFWEEIAASGTNDSLQSLKDEIVDSGGGSLDKVFHDFAICNYTRQFDVSALPNSTRYRYLDELPGNGGGPAYDNVSRTATFNSFPANVSSSINAYSAKYYEMTFDESICQVVGMIGESTQPIAWALVGVTPDDRATILSKGVGSEYGRSFITSPTDPINRLCAIIVGLGSSSSFEFTFDMGTPRLTIVRPTLTKLAYPGPANDPGRFLARVFVEGPSSLKPPGVGDRSIKGLRVEDFSAKVGNVPANIISASYVGNEYWLVIEAPTQPADGLYDLEVILCEGVPGAGSVADITKSSVLYADITINHMIVLDKSGSMADPTDSPKLAAAQSAASLYVDAVSPNDRVGVVAFDGNQVDCDDDSTLLESIGQATPAKRSSAKTKIGNLTAGGWTSIGDGLWRAQDQFDLVAGLADIHAAVLLSDGDENEARWWDTAAACDTAASRLIPEDTIVNTIAFGPESNQSLMQSIAASTGGDYGYVDVSDSGASAPAAARAADMISTPGNRLADQYMKSYQQASGLQRLFFEQGMVPGGGLAEVKIPVLEDGITDAVVFAHWATPKAITDVRLFDENGNPIGAADADIFETTSHKVYHLKNKPGKGQWRLTLDGDPGEEYIVGLLGKPSSGLDMFLQLVQVNTGGPFGEPQLGMFEQGVPVTILAVLTDRKGPVLSAGLDLAVQKPDGTLACGPLTLRDDGAHNDGEAGDGVYGAIFTDTSQAGTIGGVVNDDPKNPAPGGALRGTYNVTVDAVGESNFGDKFVRQDKTSFHIFASTDRDGDQLPDTWEEYYGTEVTKPDADLDPDEDGLRHIDEFKEGTHPFDEDTDDGGENDGSEVKGGRCPLEPSDDLLPCPLDVEAVMNLGDEGPGELRPNRILLRFPQAPSYQGMNILRRRAGTNDPWQLIDKIDLNNFKPPYHDAPPMNKVPYAYRFQAIGAQGALSCLSPVTVGVALAQPVPPKPWATLNNESALTDRLAVKLRLDRSGAGDFGAPKEFRAANVPLTTEAFKPIPANPVDWMLAGPVADPGVRKIHVQYRDADGNLSEQLLETIEFDPFGDFDNDGQVNDGDPDDDDDGLPDVNELQIGTNAFDPDSDDDGLEDRTELNVGTNPLNPDTDGDGLLDGDDPMPLSPADKGDFDGDGDIDQDDIDLWEQCASGPDVPVQPGCEDYDFDGDGDTDQEDFGKLQACLSGDGVPPVPNCLGD